ncbi:hypothetical protein ABG768_010626 [Culter alburnus]|uniref:Uncharacterized protein n=1 Tax=Culter alburnus TaxID=194366 RepID=A0AAW1ZC89_CULAL
MDEDMGLTQEEVKERRRATDLVLHAPSFHQATMHQVMVAVKCHLWLNITEIREKEKVFLLGDPISHSGLFGEVVNSVVDKFNTAETQSAVLKQFMPRRAREPPMPAFTPRAHLAHRKETSKRSE